MAKNAFEEVLKQAQVDALNKATEKHEYELEILKENLRKAKAEADREVYLSNRYKYESEITRIQLENLMKLAKAADEEDAARLKNPRLS